MRGIKKRLSSIKVVLSKVLPQRKIQRTKPIAQYAEHRVGLEPVVVCNETMQGLIRQYLIQMRIKYGAN